MTDKPIQTVAGPFDRSRLRTLETAIGEETGDTIVMFEGQELLASFGIYLVEYIKMELGKRNTEGL